MVRNILKATVTAVIAISVLTACYLGLLVYMYGSAGGQKTFDQAYWDERPEHRYSCVDDLTRNVLPGMHIDDVRELLGDHILLYEYEDCLTYGVSNRGFPTFIDIKFDKGGTYEDHNIWAD